MIRSFRHRGLRAFWLSGNRSKIAAELADRIRRRLDAIDAAVRPTELSVPGFDFHSLRGMPQRFSVHVNGPWCLTFGWDGDDAVDVDLENYH